jgi:hypothetical protein
MYWSIIVWIFKIAGIVAAAIIALFLAAILVFTVMRITMYFWGKSSKEKEPRDK